jgi:predicted nucleotidyltransferase component of viral defense system
MNLKIDYVIETTLIAIYSKDVLSEKIYLKGGQALRIKEQLTNRFSADIDFSYPDKIENEDVFFHLLENAIKEEFFQNNLCLFDFKATKRPKRKSDGAPDFWSGWAIEFKLIEEQKRNLEIEQRRREALIPDGTASSKITIDISEYEYCNSVEKVTVKGVDINVYSRTLLLVEKIRAICQQHPKYPHKAPDQRGRDYYDIERLWSKVLQSGDPEAFLNDCAKHIQPVFDAKEVDLDFLEKIFEKEFVDLQRLGWKAVKDTVAGDLQSFDYYNETLATLITDIKKRI